MENLSKKRCLLDTNILVAYINRSHVHHEQAVKIIDRLVSGDFYGVISSQNILELSAVLIHGLRQSREEVANDIQYLSADNLLEIIYPQPQVLAKFFSLLKKIATLHVTDVFLLATAIVYEVDVIVTGDGEFIKAVRDEIDAYNPLN